MELKEIVLKLTGEIQPVGETTTDNKRFENLKVLCELVNELVSEIDNVSFYNKDRCEYSMNRSGKYANEFLLKL